MSNGWGSVVLRLPLIFLLGLTPFSTSSAASTASTGLNTNAPLDRQLIALRPQYGNKRTGNRYTNGGGVKWGNHRTGNRTSGNKNMNGRHKWGNDVDGNRYSNGKHKYGNDVNGNRQWRDHPH